VPWTAVIILNTAILEYNIELNYLTCLIFFVFSSVYVINYLKIHIRATAILLLFLSLHVSQSYFITDKNNIL
jgi:hypothetical protein